MLPPQQGRRNSLIHIPQTATLSRAQTACISHPLIRVFPVLSGNCSSNAAEKGSPPESDFPGLLCRARERDRLCCQTRVTSIPVFLRAFRSDCGMFRSLMICCSAVGGTISDKLRRPNLLESQTATVRLATSTITRFTFASRRLGVLRP